MANAHDSLTRSARRADLTTAAGSHLRVMTIQRLCLWSRAPAAQAAIARKISPACAVSTVPPATSTACKFRDRRPLRPRTCRRDSQKSHSKPHENSRPTRPMQAEFEEFVRGKPYTVGMDRLRKSFMEMADQGG